MSVSLQKEPSLSGYRCFQVSLGERYVGADGTKTQRGELNIVRGLLIAPGGDRIYTLLQACLWATCLCSKVSGGFLA